MFNKQISKIPDLKVINKKERIVKASILAILFFVLNCLISSTYYVSMLKYPKFFGNGILGKKIYLLNIFNSDLWIIFKRTPLATEKLRMIFFVLLLAIPLPFLFLRKRKWKDEHGSARWGDYDDLRANKKGKNKIATLDFLATDGVVIGEVGEKVLHDNENTHMSLIAPTRGGKGVGFVIPTLIEGWKQSVVVLDIKKENFNYTSGHRAEKFNNKIIKFEALSDDSSKYNPLDELGYLTPKEIENARSMATNIVGKVNEKDPHWDIMATNLIAVNICYSFYFKRRVGDKKDKVRARLTDVAEFITNPKAPIQKRMQEYIEGKDKEALLNNEDKEILKQIYFNATDREMIDRGIHPFIAKEFSFFSTVNEKEFSSIVSTAKTKLSVFELPTVAKNTSKSDFKIMDLVDGENPVSLYIVVAPGDIELLSPLLRVMIVQLIDKLTSDIRKKKWRILFMLDEFTSIGKMDKIKKGLAYTAGYALKIVLILQGLDQLTETYGKENGILSNCQTRIFFRPNDNETAEYLHKQLGVRTIKTKSYSDSKGGRSKSTNWTHRDLLTPAEISQFPSGKSIILTGIKPPLAVDKVLYFERKDMKNLVKKQPRFYSEGQLFFEKADDRGEYSVDISKTKILDRELYDSILMEKARDKEYEIIQLDKMKISEINKQLGIIIANSDDKIIKEAKEKLLEVIPTFSTPFKVKDWGGSILGILAKYKKINFSNKNDKYFVERIKSIIDEALNHPLVIAKFEENKLKKQEEKIKQEK